MKIKRNHNFLINLIKVRTYDHFNRRIKFESGHLLVLRCFNYIQNELVIIMKRKF